MADTLCRMLSLTGDRQTSVAFLQSVVECLVCFLLQLGIPLQAAGCPDFFSSSDMTMRYAVARDSRKIEDSSKFDWIELNQWSRNSN